MIYMWAFLKEGDVEAYAASLLLPSYLSHLRLAPFKLAAQAKNCDGQESLKLTYHGENRLEEYTLGPEEHVLAMIRFVCPRINSSRIQLPRDDARWHWTTCGDPAEAMRIYFAPTTRVLHRAAAPAPPEDAYVSVSRGHAFIGRSVVESYLVAWFEHLGIREAAVQCDLDTPSAGVEFTAGAIGGQMFLTDDVIAEDLMRFARLDKALAHVSSWAVLDMDSATEGDSGIYEDGLYIRLSQPDE